MNIYIPIHLFYYSHHSRSCAACWQLGCTQCKYKNISLCSCSLHLSAGMYWSTGWSKHGNLWHDHSPSLKCTHHVEVTAKEAEASFFFFALKLLSQPPLWCFARASADSIKRKHDKLSRALLASFELALKLLSMQLPSACLPRCNPYHRAWPFHLSPCQAYSTHAILLVRHMISLTHTNQSFLVLQKVLHIYLNEYKMATHRCARIRVIKCVSACLIYSRHFKHLPAATVSFLDFLALLRLEPVLCAESTFTPT